MLSYKDTWIQECVSFPVLIMLLGSFWAVQWTITCLLIQIIFFSFHCHWRIWSPRGVWTFICHHVWKIYSFKFCNGSKFLLHMWPRTWLSGGLHQFCIHIHSFLQQGFFSSKICSVFLFFFVGVKSCFLSEVQDTGCELFYWYFGLIYSRW